MELGCLIMYHREIANEVKEEILRTMYKEYMHEMEVIDDHRVLIYVWNITKDEIWQGVANLQSTNIVCGYGFGSVKKEAKQEAVEKLFTTLSTDDNVP